MIILQDDIRDKLNQCRFSGLEDIAVGDALHYFGGYMPDEKYCRLKVRFRTAAALLTSRLDVQASGSGRIIFVYSYSGRQDYFDWFRKVCVLAENKTLFLPGERKYTLKRMHYRNHLRQWKSQMKEKGFGRLERRIYALSILQSAEKLWDIESYIQERQIDPSLVMVVCDTHADDSMIVQRFNAMKIDTACLQHGNFEASSESWIMEGSHSKYYLVYGEYTKRQFLKLGRKLLLYC